MTKKRRLTKKTIDDKLKKLSLVFSFEGVRKRIKGSIIILDSSMAEHPAVNRQVTSSSLVTPIYFLYSGALAQLVAHDTGSVGVRGSNPLRSRFYIFNEIFKYNSLIIFSILRGIKQCYIMTIKYLFYFFYLV